MRLTALKHCPTLHGMPGDTESGRTNLRSESHVPYYVQLKYILKARIRTSAPHTALPSEQALSEEFGVSRPVVRQALSELVHDGLIYRLRGKGSYVAAPKIMEDQVQRLTSMQEELRSKGYEPVTVVLQQEVLEAEPLVSEQLEIAPGRAIVALRRLRILDGEPLMIDTTLLPHDLCAGLENIDLSSRSLYETLASEFGLKIARGSRTLEAVGAGSEIADALQIPPGSPVMHIELISYADNGRPLELSDSYHRGNRARFRFEVLPSDRMRSHESGSVRHAQRMMQDGTFT